MFFSITQSSDNRFPNNHQIGTLWFNCDNGWKRIQDRFYKGYDETYCCVIVDNAGARVEHSQLRGFPLWYQDGIITNIEIKDTPAWNDDRISMDPQGKVASCKVTQDLSIPLETITTTEAIRRIRERLDSKLRVIPENIKLFCSGGLDTLLLYSMLAGRHEFELVTGEHYESDAFTDQNQTLLNKFWAYTQIHHWTLPTWLATGSQGDEYFLRGPAIISMLTSWHDINFIELLNANPDSYHYRYFNKYPDLWKTAWDNRHEFQEQYPTIDLLNQQIMNILVNDYQHWHLGNTLTWTPYKDIEIPKILLQCNINDLLPQFLDGRLTKDLIIDYNPDIINYLSKYKNYNSQENLQKLYKYHAKLIG